MGWTDGLPFVPPTEAAMAEMPEGTELPAARVVTKMLPRGGKATFVKSAVNVVMGVALIVRSVIAS